jgi:O-antigen ligase
MRAWSAVCLGVLLALAILLMWVPGAWINPSLFEAGLFLLAGAWCVRFVFRPGDDAPEMRWSFGMIPLAGIVAWGALQLATGSTVSRWETWTRLLVWAGNLAAFWVAVQIGQDPKVRRTLLRAMVVFGFAISVISMLQYFSAPTKVLWFYQDVFPRFGPFQNRDRYADFALLLLPVAVFQGIQEGDAKWSYTAAAATFFAAVIAGASRAGSALVAGEAVMLAILGWGQRRLNGAVALFSAMALVFTAVVGVGALMDRFGEPDAYGSRRAYLETAMAMVKDRPGMGFGLGNWENAYPAYATVDSDKIINEAHNDWAQWAVEGGLPLLGMMLCLAVWIVPKAIRSVWGIGIVAVLAHAAMDFPFHAPAIEFWFFTLMGILAAEQSKNFQSETS